MLVAGLLNVIPAVFEIHLKLNAWYIKQARTQTETVPYKLCKDNTTIVCELIARSHTIAAVQQLSTTRLFI